MRLRWTQHCSHARRHNGARFSIYEAMRLSGIGSFKMVEIAHAHSLDEAKTLETKFIRLFRTMDINYGYNGNSGGQGHEISQETRRKLSLANSGENNPWYGKRGSLSPSFGMKRSSESRRKMRESRRRLFASGYSMPPLPPESRERVRLASVGRVYSDETKQKMREAKIGKKLSPEHIQHRSTTIRKRIDGLISEISQLHSNGWSARRISRTLGCGLPSVLLRIRELDHKNV